MKMLFVIVALLVGGCATVEADFFECAPGNTLKVCPVGQKPAGECRNVGSGTTTLPFSACS
jgi:hypothetical protein